SGEFSPDHRPRLTAATLEQADVAGALLGLIGGVSDANTRFTNQRQATVNDLLAQIQNNATAQSVLDRNDVLRAQLDDAITRGLALQAREISDGTQLAKFQQAFEAVAGSLDPNSLFQTRLLTPVMASAGDAHFPIAAVQPDLARDTFHT